MKRVYTSATVFDAGGSCVLPVTGEKLWERAVEEKLFALEEDVEEKLFALEEDVEKNLFALEEDVEKNLLVFEEKVLERRESAL